MSQTLEVLANQRENLKNALYLKNTKRKQTKKIHLKIQKENCRRKSMNANRENFQKIESGLNSLKGKEYISETTVDFFRNLLKAQHEIKSQLCREKIPFLPTGVEIKEKMQKGIPLLTPDTLPLNESYLQNLFQAVCEIMIDYEESDSVNIQTLMDAQSNKKLHLKNLIEKLFQHDRAYFHSLSENLKVSEDILLFVTLNLAKPFFEAASEQIVGKISDKVMKDTIWLKHFCPVCGGSAQLAKLEKESGKKILCCSLCGTEWRFMRVKCPFCCNEEQKSMKFLAEDKSPYRIDVCEQCKRYIKTIDERKGGEEKKAFVPSVADLATLYLDIVAGNEGYERSWFFPPLVDELKAGSEGKTVH